VPFRADIVLPIDDYFDQVLALLACHESQVFEWLPYTMGLEVAADRMAWLARFYGARPKRIARSFASGARYAEAFEISEYGRQMTADECKAMLGLPS
jgi:hypothetical protein